MKLYIVRHGDPDYVTDSLTELGKQQADAVVKPMAEAGISRIFSSPLGRARQTAQPSADHLGLPVKIEHWTREIWPELTLVQSDGSRRFCMGLPAQLYRDPQNRTLGDSWYTIPELSGMEGRQAYDRLIRHSDDFLRRLGYKRVSEGLYRIIRPNDESVALFCHGGFTMAWLPHLLALPPHLFWASFGIGHTGVTLIEFPNDPSGVCAPTCRYLSDASHLRMAGVPVTE